MIVESGKQLARRHTHRPRPPRAVLRSRLRLLVWTVDEARRKQVWQTRNGLATAAEDSWVRAIPFLCGAACLGCTAVEVFAGEPTAARWER
jgi:hypothetical protein